MYVLSGLSETKIYEYVGSAAFEVLGSKVESLEDWDVDGGGGEVVLYHSGTLSSPYKVEEPYPYWTCFGESVTGLGDVSGDGVPDLAIGAPANFDAKFDCTVGFAGIFSGADGALVHEFQGEAPQSQFGFRLASPGDFNADGFDDLVVSSPGCCNMQCTLASDGRLYFFDGLTGALLDTLDSPGTNRFFGIVLAAAHDVNGNGVADVLALDDLGPDRGEIYLIEGATREVIYSILYPFPPGTNLGSGAVMVGVDDLDGDDFPDFLVASPSGLPSASRIDLFSGAPIGVDSFGSACPTDGGTLPRIGATGTADIGESYQLHLSRVAPGLIGLLGVGVSNTSWLGVPLPLDLGPVGMPGCELSVAPTTVIPAVTLPTGPAEGAATVALPIPDEATLIGASVYAQWFVMNPPGSPTLGATTRGLAITFQ